MAKIDDYKEKLEVIKNADFTVDEVNFCGKVHRKCKLLRDALLFSEGLYYVNASKDEKNKLELELEEIMKDKFRSLNPSFSEEIIKCMPYSYMRSDIIYPMDIIVIDDMIFNKEATLSEGSNRIHKIKTFMYTEINGYFDVLSDWFFSEIYYHDKKNDLTCDEEERTSRVLSYNINNIFGSEIVKPLQHGVEVAQFADMDISLNMSFLDFGKTLRDKKECDLKLCIRNGEDITLYYIHQSFKDSDPVWLVMDSTKEVWTLTDAIKKKKGKYTALIKTNDVLKNTNN